MERPFRDDLLLLLRSKPPIWSQYDSSVLSKYDLNLGRQRPIQSGVWPSMRTPSFGPISDVYHSDTPTPLATPGLARHSRFFPSPKSERIRSYAGMTDQISLLNLERDASDVFDRQNESFYRKDIFDRRSDVFDPKSNGFDRKGDGDFSDRKSDIFDRKSDVYDSKSNVFTPKNTVFERNETFEFFNPKSTIYDKNDVFKPSNSILDTLQNRSVELLGHHVNAFDWGDENDAFLRGVTSAVLSPSGSPVIGRGGFFPNAGASFFSPSSNIGRNENDSGYGDFFEDRAFVSENASFLEEHTAKLENIGLVQKPRKLKASSQNAEHFIAEEAHKAFQIVQKNNLEIDDVRVSLVGFGLQNTDDDKEDEKTPSGVEPMDCIEHPEGFASTFYKRAKNNFMFVREIQSKSAIIKYRSNLAIEFRVSLPDFGRGAGEKGKRSKYKLYAVQISLGELEGKIGGLRVARRR